MRARHASMQVCIYIAQACALLGCTVYVRAPVRQRPFHLIAFMLGLVWASTWPCWSVRNHPWSTAFWREPLSQYSSSSHVSSSCSSLFPCVSCACTVSMERPAHAESAWNVLRMQSQHGTSCACRVSMERPAHAESAWNVLRMQSQHGTSCVCRVSIERPTHAESALNVLRVQSQRWKSCACRVSVGCPAHAESALDVLRMQSQR